VADYRAAIVWAAQTALREIIGQMPLADIQQRGCHNEPGRTDRHAGPGP